MSHIIFRFLNGVGLFLFAIVLLNNVLSLSDKKIPIKLEKKLQNPLISMATGLIFAMITQSSSAINSITLNLTDKKVLSQKTAYYVVLGTNIGTTVAGYIALLSKISFSEIVVAVIFFSALFMLIFKESKTYKINFLISSIALIFTGLSVISHCIPDMILNFDLTLLNSQTKFMALLISLIITAVCQSSSLVTVIIVTLSTYGILDINIAIFMIMGANVGTTSTALLASIGTTKSGVKVGIFCVLFNIIGVLLFLLFYYCGLLNWFIKLNVAQDTKIALFNTLFNVVTMLFVFGFVKEIDDILSYKRKIKTHVQLSQL